MKRVITLLFVVSLAFGMMGASEAKIIPFDEIPIRSAGFSPLPGGVVYFTGSTGVFQAYGPGSLPGSGFGVLPREENRNASSRRGFSEKSLFDTGTLPGSAEYVSPLSSSRASASDNIDYGKVSPFSKPSMMLLVGCGLVGLAGIGRKMFQGRRMFRK